MPAKKNNINLLPKDKFSQSISGKILTWGLTFGRYLLIFTELIVMGAFLMRFRYDMQLASLREDIKESQQIISSYQDLESQFRYLQARLNASADIIGKSSYPTALLNKISQVTPNDIYFHSISINGNSINLSGTANSDIGLVTLLSEIKKNSAFNQASLNTLNSKGENDPTLEFSIKATIAQ